MPSFTFTTITIVTTVFALVLAAVHAIATCYHKPVTSGPPTDTGSIREKLPRDLKSWRMPPGYEHTGSVEPLQAIWTTLQDFFQQRGYTLWKLAYGCRLQADLEGAVPSGFMYSMPHRARNTEPGNLCHLFDYDLINGLTYPARSADGRDVVIRVLAVGSEGQEHVELLKLIAYGPHSLMSCNHTLPLHELIELDDITFGVFPKVGHSVSMAYSWWADASVGDILDILTQCLESLVFLHYYGIAHRDAYKDNFLAQWLPESLDFEHIPPSRPRVYMNDFELAVRFPRQLPQEQRVVAGPPYGGSLPDHNGRELPPEVSSGKPYDPFKLDVWQLGYSFGDFKSTIPAIDTVLSSMTDPDPATRPSAFEAMKALLDVMADIPPRKLMIEPEITPRRSAQVETNVEAL